MHDPYTEDYVIGNTRISFEPDAAHPHLNYVVRTNNKFVARIGTKELEHLLSKTKVLSRKGQFHG